MSVADKRERADSSGSLSPIGPATRPEPPVFAPDRRPEVGKTRKIGPKGEWMLTVTKKSLKYGLYLGDMPVGLVSCKVTVSPAGEECTPDSPVLLEYKKATLKFHELTEDDWLYDNVLYPAMRTMKIEEGIKLRLPSGTHQVPDQTGDVHVELEMHNYYSVVNAWPDSSEYGSDKVCVHISGRHPCSAWKATNFDYVAVHYRLETADDQTLIYDTREQGRSHKFTLGCGDVFPGLDLATMKVSMGQSGYVEVAPEAGFGPYIMNDEMRDLYIKQGRGGRYLAEEQAAIFDPPDSDAGIGRTLAFADGERVIGTSGGGNPDVLLLPSDMDMRQYLEKYSGRPLLLKNFQVVDLVSIDLTSHDHHRVRLDFAVRLQQLAKRFFDVGDLIRAERCYDHALSLVEELKHTEQQRLRRGAEEVRIRANMALTYLKLRLPDKCIKVASELPPDHAKGCYLTGRAHVMLDDDASAETWYLRALRIEPNNADVKNALKELRDARQAQTKPEERRRMQQMLESARFAEERPRTEYIAINQDVSLPVDSILNNSILETFGIHAERVDRPPDCTPVVLSEGGTSTGGEEAASPLAVSSVPSSN